MKLRFLVLPLLALTACPRLDPMQRQPKYKAYREGSATREGVAMLHPPEGTVRYRAPLEPAVATGRAPDGKPLAVSPVAIDAKLISRGRTRYEVSCAVCHGLLGDGESQVALNMSLRRPPSLHLYRDVPDGHIFGVITNGFGLMPSYSAELTVEDRWAVVAYVRALQLSQHATIEQVPPDARERLNTEAR
jgi:mono/diheme cytochrome c family protein